MHLRFIGLNMERFYKNFKNSTTLQNIIKFWKIDSLKNTELSKQINEYFDNLQNIIENNEDINIRECLIIKVNNTYDPEINSIIEKMDELSSLQFMPLVLILTSENSNKKIVIDTEKYDEIDPRLFFIENYTEDPDIIEKKIVPIILRFCSIHNDLGDAFILNEGEKNEEKFDLIEKAFPFNLNIFCFGRFGQGKSTGINQILQEYKAKENNRGFSQRKYLTYYQVKNKPIRIFEVPDFENEKIVEEELKRYHEKFNKLKNSIHIILYFLNFFEYRAFMELEYPILEEITKHESAKIIYVITHSKLTNPKNKNKIYNKINSGIQDITRNKPIFNQRKKLEATENNVVFVNFHYNEELDIKPFGRKELFKKIYDFYFESNDYKEILHSLSNEEIEKKALYLRMEANNLILPNKIWSAATGVIPFANLALQELVIEKNAIKKISEIFGIDTKLIEDYEKEKAQNKELHSGEYKGVMDGLTLEGEVIGNIAVVGLSGLIGGLGTGYFCYSAFAGLLGLAASLGAGIFGYSTHIFCEKTLDKFVEYYKMNSNKIKNSYKEAADYFLN